MKVKWQSDAPNMELKVPSEIKIDGYIPTEQDLMFTGDCRYLFYDLPNRQGWLLRNYGSKIKVINPISLYYVFAQPTISNQNWTGIKIKDIKILCNKSKLIDCSYAFNMYQNEDYPQILDCYPRTIDYMFSQNNQLKRVDDTYFQTWDCSHLDNWQYMFQSCLLLETIDLSILEQTQWNRYNQYYGFQSFLSACRSLKKVSLGLPTIEDEFNITSNKFPSIVGGYNDRLRHFQFKKKSQQMRMSGQVLDFSRVGYSYADTYNYPPNGTSINLIKNDTTYQTLKNDPDAWTAKPEYAFYNHDSAVETINSLPDTSAFLTEKGGTNTIKFTGNAGSKTDGGAINTMTAEEIAVAAAKGWTVTLV